jgi:hypothetical protein
MDTGEHQRVDAIGAQQRLQVGAEERADAVLDHDRFPLSCGRGRVDRGAFTPGHRNSVCLQRAEQGVTGADLTPVGRLFIEPIEMLYAWAAKNDDALSKLRRRRKKHQASRDKVRVVQ